MVNWKWATTSARDRGSSKERPNQWKQGPPASLVSKMEVDQHTKLIRMVQQVVEKCPDGEGDPRVDHLLTHLNGLLTLSRKELPAQERRSRLKVVNDRVQTNTAALKEAQARLAHAQHALAEAEATHAELQKRQTLLEEEYAVALEAVQANPFDPEPHLDDDLIPNHGIGTPKGVPGTRPEEAWVGPTEGLPTPTAAAEPGTKRARNWKEESLYHLQHFASQLEKGVTFPDNDGMQVDGTGAASSSGTEEAPFGLLGPTREAAPQGTTGDHEL